MSTYRTDFGSMYLFLIKDAKLFNKNIMNFGKKFSGIMIKKFNGKTCML